MKLYLRIMDNKNSFTELDREAVELRELAEFCRLPALPVDVHAAKLRTDLLELLTEKVPTDEEIGRIMTEFRQGLANAKCPIDAHSFIGAVVATVALARDDADNNLVEEYNEPLKKALAAIATHESFRYGWSVYKLDQVDRNLDSLMHATSALTNFDQNSMSYATQDDIDTYFYLSYYNGIKCKGGDMWIDVKMEMNRNYELYLEKGELAHNFTNSFFNFLQSVSEHPRCSRELQTGIRTHLISFTNNEAKERRGWKKPFDIENVDLRVSVNDLDFTNANSSFTLKDERYKTTEYCYDLIDTNNQGDIFLS